MISRKIAPQWFNFLKLYSKLLGKLAKIEPLRIEPKQWTNLWVDVPMPLKIYYTYQGMLFSGAATLVVWDIPWLPEGMTTLTNPWGASSTFWGSAQINIWTPCHEMGEILVSIFLQEVSMGQCTSSCRCEISALGPQSTLHAGHGPEYLHFWC